MAEQRWWNNSGGTVVVDQFWWNSSGVTVMVEQHGGTVLVEQ